MVERLILELDAGNTHPQFAADRLLFNALHSLETILKATGRDTIIECGAWTNMSIEHTARTGADKGYLMVIPEDACSTMNVSSARHQRQTI